jgi:RNA polymerase sigma-70 factor, ECF subfamily
VNADDQRLIAECLKGRTAAFEMLVRRYQDRLYNTVYRLLGNAEDAEDVVQEAYIHAYQSLRSFKGDALFFTWLYRIAVNAAISWKRKERAVLRWQTEGNADRVGQGPPNVMQRSEPAAALLRAEEVERIQAALQRVSPEHRMVLILKDMDGHKYDAMAEILNVPVGTIRSRLHRARLELRQVLEQMENG